MNANISAIHYLSHFIGMISTKYCNSKSVNPFGFDSIRLSGIYSKYRGIKSGFISILDYAKSQGYREVTVEGSRQVIVMGKILG